MYSEEGFSKEQELLIENNGILYSNHKKLSSYEIED